MNDDLPNLPTYMFQPNLPGLISLALTIVLPLLVALLVKAGYAPWVKGLYLLALASVKTFLEAWLAAVNSGEPFAFYNVLYAVLINFGIAVAAHFGLLKTAAHRLQAHGVKDRASE